MQVFTFFLIVLIILGIILFLYIKLRKPKKSTIISYSGKLGGGKTYNGTEDAIKFIRKSRRKWSKVNKPFLYRLLYLIPYFDNKRKKSEYYGLDKPMLYSNYPILISGSYKHPKELSLPITNDIMFLRESIPLGSIVIIDEFSSWISQFEFNEVYSQTLNDHIQKWRHYHNNDSHLIIIDQCSNNIPIQVRYRLNQVVCCIECSHLFGFIHITKYKNIDLTDDVKNVEIVENDSADSDDKVLRMLRLHFGRHYDDRAFSNRYFYVDENEKHSKISLSPFKALLSISKPMPNEKYPILDVVIKKDLKQKEIK